MKIAAAINVVTAWSRSQVMTTPGLFAIYIAGSASRNDPDSELSGLSDVDIYFVVDDGALADLHQRKVLVEGVIVDQAYFPVSNYRDPQRILSDFGYADHLNPSNVLHDPHGLLSQVGRVVRAEYRKRAWVERRLSRLHELASGSRAQLSNSAPELYDSVFPLLWMCYGICGMPMAALLLPPTTRKCVRVFRTTCEHHGSGKLAVDLHRLLGLSSLAACQIPELVTEYERAFDFGVSLTPTSGFLDFDVAPLSRPLMVDGVWDLIRAGTAGDAGLWLLLGWTVVMSRIQKSAPPDARAPYVEAYDGFLSSLDMMERRGVQTKAADGERLIAECYDFAVSLMERNREVERTSGTGSR